MEYLRNTLSLHKKIVTWFGKKGVIVFTMGKVGTLTICHSLHQIGINHVHPHSLRFTRPGVHFLRYVPLSFFEKLYFFWKTLLKRLKVWLWLRLKNEIIIITGLRDPFSRSISAFFEQSHYLNLDLKRMNFRSLNDYFNKYYSLDGTVNWFEEEIEKVFGINVYSYPFDKKRGFSVIQQGKIRIFLYRVDFLDQLEDELCLFLSQPNFKLLKANETSDTENYVRFQNERKFSSDDFMRIRHKKFMNHFFLEDEIEDLKNRWIDLSTIENK